MFRKFKRKAMKIPPLAYLAITSLILVTVAIFAAMGFPFSWVFYLTVVGQVFLVITVYQVLTDDYHTEKTFDDFYEDFPITRDD